MNMLAFAINTAERAPLSDGVTLAGIDFLCGRTKRKLASTPATAEDAFARSMADFPIATHTDDANRQHYELPPEFFSLALGPQRKYSCALYLADDTTLAEAESYALAETVRHAELSDGMDILELGCGWGSLSLYMAQHFPNARITSVSNSAPQREHILSEIERLKLDNLTVITADMNGFQPGKTFGRIVSVEMFEHMSNWRSLLSRARLWLRPEGRLFLHVFSHRASAYRFDHADKADWIAQHFFTGGVMPSHGLVREFSDSFTVEKDWRWNGRHYERTALDWLKNFDANRAAIRAIFADTYGADAILWMRRWRLFFLATAGLFGHANGEEWGVSHYLLRPAAQ